jgi:type III restriction enzyme
MNGVRSSNLVLRVSQQSAFDIAPYERFLDQLTYLGGPQQNEALHIAARYLLGGHYPDLLALGAENWDHNPLLRDHHNQDRPRFMAGLELGPLLAGSIDHATATGKSYIIFGAAVLALASGQVDRVLVLCPSTTIEEGLSRKFSELVRDPGLMDLLPEEAAIRLPAIVNAYEASVPEGSICVENIHAAYDRSLSSIRSSFLEQGERTLVVNDEAHHIYRTKLKKRGGDQKEWARFLLDPAFGFRRVLNVSGTCFIDNAYFSDVIHRYSLQEARADKRIKDVRYWESDKDFPSDQARWEAVLANHEDNRTRYPGVKPITIFVTDKIGKAKDIHADFQAFLAAKAGISADEAGKPCLIVSSDPEHAANLPILRAVDAPGNEVEFIFSVSMLSEGWDVKNVLQIVPHEKRAFDSKLLISQVLGRGLRVLTEPQYRDTARVVVFNHASWAPEMRRLFDDVWYDDVRIESRPVPNSPHHFEVDLLDVSRDMTATAASATLKGRAAGERLHLLPQHTVTTAGRLTNLEGRGIEQRYRYDEPTRTLDECMAEIEAKFTALAIETGEDQDIDLNAIRDEIAEAMKRAKIADDQLSESNREIALAWLTRPSTASRRMKVRTVHENLRTMSTAGLHARAMGRSELAANSAIALRTDNDRAVRWPGYESGQYELLDQVIADPNRKNGAVIKVTDERLWRTPLDVTLVAFSPERVFVNEVLTRPCVVEDWVKSRDTGFYEIPYTVSKGGLVRNRTFNPDWILRAGAHVLVVETKDDQDVSDENRAKLAGAKDWFAQIDRLLTEAREPRRYFFYFLGQSDVIPFFDAVCAGTYPTFLSTLQSKLEAGMTEAPARAAVGGSPNSTDAVLADQPNP